MKINALLTVLAIAGAVYFFKIHKPSSANEMAREIDLFDDGRFEQGFPFN